MSLINLGAGLSAMGQGIANYASTAGLDAQKADLEQQTAVLANQLATQRDSVNQEANRESQAQQQAASSALADKQIQASKDLEAQRETATHTEGEATRANAVTVANISPDATVSGKPFTLPSGNMGVLMNDGTTKDTGIKAAPQSATSLTDDAIDSIARRVKVGDTHALAGLGYGNSGAANRAAVQNRLTDIMNEEGSSPEQVALAQATFSKSANAFATGQQGNAVRSFNVGLNHLDTLEQLSHALSNGDTQAVNKLRNIYQTQFGETAPTNFAAVKPIVADELVKMIVGTGGALGDRDKFDATISGANSPEQMSGVIGTYKQLAIGQISGLKQQYQQSTGLSNFDDKLSPMAKSLLASHAPPSGNGGTGPSSIPATPPSSGPSIDDLLKQYGPQ